MYVPALLSTTKAHNTQRSISYGDGARVDCSLYSDHVRAGGLLAEEQLLGAAPAHEIRDATKSNKSNGLPGLEFAKKNTLNLVETLKVQKRVKHASLSLIGPRNDPKLAAKIDGEAIVQPRGYFVIGSVDPKFYSGEIAWCPELAMDRWIVKLDAVKINGKTIFEDQRALIDTGNSYITVSPKTFTLVRQSIPGSIVDPNRGLTFAFPKESISSVEFVLGGRSLKLNPQDFSLGNWTISSNSSYLSSIQKSPLFPSGYDNMWVLVCQILSRRCDARGFLELIELRRAVYSLITFSRSSITTIDEWASQTSETRKLREKCIVRHLSREALLSH